MGQGPLQSLQSDHSSREVPPQRSYSGSHLSLVTLVDLVHSLSQNKAVEDILQGQHLLTVPVHFRGREARSRWTQI